MYYRQRILIVIAEHSTNQPIKQYIYVNNIVNLIFTSVGRSCDVDSPAVHPLEWDKGGVSPNTARQCLSSRLRVHTVISSQVCCVYMLYERGDW